MKKYFFAAMILVLGFSACQDEPKEKPEEKTEKTTAETDSLKILKGEYIYVDSAAVLKGNDYIYGVVIDSMAKALAQKVDSLKRNEFDMVPVILKGTVKPNKKEVGWDEILTIKEILRVSEPVSDPAIRIEGDKKSI